MHRMVIMKHEGFEIIRARHAAARRGDYGLKYDLGGVEITVDGQILLGSLDQPTWDMLAHAHEDIGRLLSYIDGMEDHFDSTD